MAPWHITEATERSKDALVSQSPIVVFKSCNMLQALGIVYSRIVLPSTDSKGETKGKTYCPATWNYAYQWQYAAEYADLLRQAGASSLLCQERILSVIAQLSNKRASHPNCAFADSASTGMSGVMVSLTPCIKASMDRLIALSENAEFKDVNDMVHKLNALLSIPTGFPQIPTPRKDRRSMQFPPDKRNAQYVMCPEQECESLVYYGDQSRSMIDVLGLGQDPFWDDRVKVFYGWYSKSASKTGQDAWTWEGKDNQKWSTTKRCFQEESISSSKPSRSHRSQGKGSSMARHWRSQHRPKLSLSRQRDRPRASSRSQRMSICARKTSSSMCGGLSRFLILIEELPKILDCIAHTVT